MNEPHPPAVVARDLRYRYPDGREALRGVSFSLQAGASAALVGPNGAGKTTLLWHLNGLLPGRSRAPLDHHSLPIGRRDAPCVWIDGIAVAEKHGPDVRRRVGLLFQDPDDQLFCDSVLEDVAFGPLNQGKPQAEARRIAQECLDRVELHNIGDRPPHHLSYGERKRVCLAGILACEPTILALDEPTANLDPRGRRTFMKLIGALPATKLIATHDLECVLQLCEHTIVLDAGQIVAEGPSRQLLSDAELMHAHGLEVPLSLALRPANSSPN